MAWCNDERITYLRKYGYNVISLPRSGIRPLTVAFSRPDGELVELGYLPEIWKSEKDEPKPIPGEDVSKIGGQSTSKLAANVGIDILGNLIQALGVDPVKVKAEYSSAKTFEFHFKEVERERITAFTLGNYLAAGELNSKDPFVKKYFQPSEKIYIVTEVLKSSGFGVTALSSSTTKLDVNVPVIKDAVSGSGAVKVEKTAQGSVEFSGDKKLPFAFIAAQLKFVKDHWEVVNFPDPGAIHLGEVAPVQSADAFEIEWKGAVLFGDGFVNFKSPNGA